jgi:toxin ParE1/3/4
MQWTAEARADVAEILLYVRARSPQAARRVKQSITRTIHFLGENPKAGQRRDDLSPGIRSLPVDRYDYLVFYEPLRDGILAIRVLHGSRDVGSLFGKS